MRVSMISAALVATLVGYGSSVAIVLAAATALSATPAQAASWLFGLCIAKAIGSAVLSATFRIPIVLAWSTPGAALIATTSGITFAEGVGAFVSASLLIALTGLLKPLGRLIALIPDGIAGAMLAGVLLPFCLKGIAAAPSLPAIIFPTIALFAFVRLWNPALAVIAALAAGIALAIFTGTSLPLLQWSPPNPIFTPPEFHLSAILGLALPLYLVTMAGQNLPGFATLRAHGYEPPVRVALGTTGGLSALFALIGSHPVNMAAITAAICLSDDVHPDRAQRWKIGLVYAAWWVALGLLGPAILSVLTALPPPLIAIIVALALLSPLMGALTTAFHAPETRFAATITLTVAASGVTFAGIAGAFWGLVAGLTIWGLERGKLALFHKPR